ncbi:MAG: VCBS repeat-containing protein, partial [Bacteroidales bacterium]|nr:VCBS repeat-containing protein [Bacteroidales bacterium]
MRHIALHTILLLGMTIFGSTTRLHAQTGGEAVGNLSGQLTVSDMGAAVYSLTFDVPNGGPLTPQIGIAYNSQTAGYGLAGYGFNITGISCITRGGKDLFHDQTVQGVTYTDEDNYFLDGKRLILKEGQQGKDGSKYCLEGDPYTEILMHNWVKTTFVVHDPGTGDEYFEGRIPYYVPDSLVDRTDETICWFEVKLTNGQKMKYGYTLDSKLQYTNRKGQEHIAAWYVNRVEDKYKNYVTYEYEKSKNNAIYPLSIVYGLNSEYSNSEYCTLLFQYKNLGENSQPCILGEQNGKYDRSIEYVTSKTGNRVYRKYTFRYDGTSDESIHKYARLKRIEEENGLGEKLSPIEFCWDYLSDAKLSVDILSLTTDFPDTELISYLSGDINGDGISDIIRLASSEKGESHNYPFVTIHLSDNSSWNYKFVSEDVSDMGSPLILDYDGDGLQDLLLPIIHSDCFKFKIISGKNVKARKTPQDNNSEGTEPDSFSSMYVDLFAKDVDVLFEAIDIDSDGKDEVICLEKSKSNGSYPIHVCHYDSHPSYPLSESYSFRIKLAHQPDRLFLADYNNDNLLDLMVLYSKHKDGYKIFFNNGYSQQNKIVYSDTNSTYGLGFANEWGMCQGDFDGDGLIDIFYINYYDDYTILRVAKNNGNGTFSFFSKKITQFYHRGYAAKYAEVLPKKHLFGNHPWYRIYCPMYVSDIDHDGRSDVFIAMNRWQNSTYKLTDCIWAMSRDSTFVMQNYHLKRRIEDTDGGCLFVGDFDGDGFVDLANYGSNLDSDNDNFDEKLKVYYQESRSESAGKITSITDGLGNNTDIQYAYATNPLVCKRSSDNKYPYNNYALPLSVVSKVSSGIGSFGSKTIKYQYEDLKIHIAGGGMLGFDKITTKEYDDQDELISTKVTAIKERDEKHLLPIEVADTCWIGDNNSTSTTSLTKTSIVEHGGTFFSYVCEKKLTDLEGNQVQTSSQYDVSKGVIIHEKVTNEADRMFKAVSYTYPEKANAFGAWLPESMTMTQKYRDDETPFSTTTTYKYDNIGNLLSTAVNAGTDLALTTTATYDKYGNVLCSVDSGYGVVSVKQLNDYDETGRYLLRSYTYPESAVKEYAYDEMGNLVSETVITNPSSPLTTTYTYDGWGRVIETLSPDGISSKTEMGWGDSDAKKYYIRKTSDGQPPVTTWYDKGGFETYKESVGPQAVSICKTTEYNNRGQVIKVERREVENNLSHTFSTRNHKLEIEEVKSQIEKLKVWQTFEYDERGRVEKEKYSTGKQTSYTYGNRTVTKDEDGREHTTLTDEWGNVIKTIDPMGNEVVYTYSSN